ncbi:MAG: hypothetical protein H6825_04800 [Planctomycetes bacterium]|nr:hypothetical protein [Planctomycetota bacterium]
MHLPRSLCSALALGVLLSSVARADTVDAAVVLGDRFEGRMDGPVDVDVVRFEALAGERVTIKVSPGKKSPVRAAIALRPLGGGTLVEVAPGKSKKTVLKAFELPSSDTYELLVWCPDADTGTYVVTTKGSLPKATLRPAAAPAPGGPEGSLLVEFDALPGMSLVASVRPGKKSDALPGVPALAGPAGDVGLDGFVTTKKSKLWIKKAPLDTFGAYALVVPNAGDAGELLAKVSLKKAKHKKVVFAEPLSYTFGGAIELTPDVVFLGENTEIAALVSLSDISTLDSEVDLVRVVDGVDEWVADMYDDGILGGHGDEIEGDRVFTARFVVDPQQAGQDDYRVTVGTSHGFVATSDAVSLLAAEPISDAQIALLLSDQSGMQAVIDQALIDGDLPQVLDDLLAQLQADPDVDEAGLSPGGTGIWLVYANGVPAVVSASTDGVKGGPTADDSAARRAAVPFDPRRGESPVLPGVERQAAFPPYSAFTPGAGLSPTSSTTALKALSKNLVGSNKVRALCAQYWDWGESDDVPAMSKLLQDDGCFVVTESKYGAEGFGVLDDWKHLGDYGVVLVSSHGDSFFPKVSQKWKGRFGWADTATGIVIVDSNVGASVASVRANAADLIAGRMVIWGTTFGLTPTFVTKYSGEMPNSVVYMSICRGAFNSTMANAFTGKGAGCFFGYTDYVAVSFCKQVGPPLLTELLAEDAMVADAFVPGLVETDSDPAEFEMWGSLTLELARGGLSDESFESGNIHGAWTTAGDARIVSGLGDASPTSGGLCAIISTGLGYTTSSGSMSQVVCLPADATLLVFDWDFFSEEFLEWCGSIYQDRFIVTMTAVDPPGAPVTLFETEVDALCGSVHPADVSFDEGDVHTTGWQSSAVDIPAAFAGTAVRLTFSCTDVGDSIYDSAILIDQIEIVSG